MRPEDLPEVGSASSPGAALQAEGQDRPVASSRSREGQRAVEETGQGLSDAFRTPPAPSSWMDRRRRREASRPREVSRGLRSEGAIQEAPKGLKTEGPVPERGSVREGGDLEREVEHALFEHLMEENKKLKRMLEQMSHASSTGSWSEVGGDGQASAAMETFPVPPPPPPLPIMTPERHPSKKPRFTPEGTRVPDSPMGKDERAWSPDVKGFPAWPGHEHCEADYEHHLRGHRASHLYAAEAEGHRASHLYAAEAEGHRAVHLHAAEPAGHRAAHLHAPEAHQDRAWHLHAAEAHQDRAWHLHAPEAHQDRAWHLHAAEPAGHRAAHLHAPEAHQDRAWHLHAEPAGHRAAHLHAPEAHQDRAWHLHAAEPHQDRAWHLHAAEPHRDRAWQGMMPTADHPGHRAYQHGGEEEEGVRAQQPGVCEQRRHLQGDGVAVRPPQAPITGQCGGRTLGVGPGGVDERGTHGELGVQGGAEARDVPTPPEARAQWIEREMKMLQGELERIKPQGMSGAYWGQPVQRYAELGGETAGKGRPRGWGVGEEKEESLRQVPIVLPKLVEPGGKNSMLDAGDWLAQLRPLVSDVCGGALRWWDNLMDATMTPYRKWLQAGPLEKLHIKAPTLQETSAGSTRLDQRVTMMIMGAIPAGVRQEIVASRDLHAAGVLFKLLRTYQPGGLSEKAMVLDAITSTKAAGSAVEAADSLRLWRRQVLRARELDTKLPDATLQVKALDRIMADVLRMDPQANFRVQTFRLQNDVDTRPTEAIIDHLYDMMLAEADGMLYNKAQTLVFKEEPAIKAMHGSPEKPAGRGVCHAWGTAAGCRYGKRCRFIHNELEDKAARCWTCSSTQHLKSACPYRQEDDEPLRSAAGGSAAEGHGGKPKAGAEEGGKSKTKGKPKGGKANSNGHGAASTAGEKADGKGKGLSSGKEPMAPVDGGEKGVASAKKLEKEGSGVGETGSTEALMTEVTSLLKALSVNANPSIKACKLRSILPAKDGSVLLDGGATHCLKTASTKEWERATPIQVQLASGTVELRQCPQTGFVLSREPVQTIIPMAKMAEMGYSLVWNQHMCEMRHAQHGKLPIVMVQGCPTVDAQWGERLVREMEQEGKRQAKIRMIMDYGILAESAWEKEMAELKCIFPQVPDHLLEQLPGREDWQGEALPFNRRRRRQIEKAKWVVVHAFAGQDQQRWKRFETSEMAMVCLDILSGENLLNANLSGWVDSLVKSGKVIAWLGGPPCRTTSLCRHRDDDGPKPVRAREGRERFGLKELSHWQQEAVDRDTVLWMKNLRWAHMVRKARGDAMVCIEQPQDPQEWRTPQTGETYPSFLAWPETEVVVKAGGLQRATFMQGDLGHPTTKPTTVLTNMERLKEVEQQQKGRKHDQSQGWPSTVEERMRMSRHLASWAPGMVEAIIGDILDYVQNAQQGPKLQALSRRQKLDAEGWERHCRAGHLPHRRDCAVCLEGAGRNRPHHRQPCPDSYCLAVDLTGPFMEGVDQEVRKPRYMMVGTVTVPVDVGGPLPEGLRSLKPEGHVEMDEEYEPSWLGDEESGEPEGWQGAEDPEPEEPLTAEEEKTAKESTAAWEQFLQGAKKQQVKTLTFAVPLASRGAGEVVQAMALRALQVPVLRVYSDRAREPFRQWVANRSLYQTFTAGDEPQGAGRTERAIGLVKARAKVLLKSAGAPDGYWPLAMRHAAEELGRAQLLSMGIPTPPMLEFGKRVMVRRKSWFQRGVAWSYPMQSATAYGPASDMSMSSGGYYLLTDDGHWVRSTVVVAPNYWPEAGAAESQKEDGAATPVGVLLDGEARPVFAV